MKSHADFKELMLKSHPGVMKVVDHMVINGWDIYCQGMRIAPSADEYLDFIDNGDIYVRSQGKKWQVLEVKNITYPFTDRKDWLFDDNVIVDAKATLDRKKYPVPLLGYMVLPPGMANWAFINERKTREHWFVKRIFDKPSGVMKDFYCVPPDLVKWGDF